VGDCEIILKKTVDHIWRKPENPEGQAKEQSSE
jgi:hypothetical protein